MTSGSEHGSEDVDLPVQSFQLVAEDQTEWPALAGNRASATSRGAWLGGRKSVQIAQQPTQQKQLDVYQQKEEAQKQWAVANANATRLQQQPAALVAGDTLQQNAQMAQQLPSVPPPLDPALAEARRQTCLHILLRLHH